MKFLYTECYILHIILSFFPYKDALALETDSSHVPDGESALKVCDTIHSTNCNTLSVLKQTQNHQHYSYNFFPVK